MLKNISIKVLSILLTMCISSSMFAVSATALNNEKTNTEIIPVQESIKKTISSEENGRADYMSKEQYSQLGFNSLPDPELFDENDTTNPLEGYKPSILSELYMGQGNYSKGDACEAYIVENVKDYENLSMKKLKDNKLSYTDRYYNDKAHGGKWQYQTSTTRSIKLGDLSGEDYVKDSIVQCSLFLDGNDGKNSKLGLLVYDYNKEKSGDDKLEKKFERIETLDDKSKFVQDIEVQESSGYMGITVGDFDGDNYEDIAVYFSYRNNPKIGIFTQSKNENKPLFEWKYSVDLKSISSDFNCCKDTNRPLVSLSTTDISGSDDLVISVTMPYSNDHDFCKDGYTAIYKWEKNQPVRKYLDKGEGSGGRMKFTSSATMDLDGDGNKELVIAANKNYGYKNGDSRGDMSEGENLVNVVLWENNQYCNAWSEPKIIEALTWVKKHKDRKEPVAITGTRFQQNSEKATLFVEGVFYDFIPSKDGETANERIKNGKFNTNSKFDGNTGDKEAFFHIAESASFVESNRLAEQTLVVMGDGSGDSIYLDIYWCYLDQGSIKINCTNNDYFDHVDEDDYGTFFTLCPIDIDNDTTYMKYTGKTVGWSNPAVHSVMLSAPYWSELDYGSTMTSRGSTSYSISTSSTNSITGNWNFGLGFSFLFSTEVKAGAGIFQQQSFGYGFNIDIGAQYAGSYQTSNTRSETLTFTSGGGEDYVALLVVPIAVYHYDQWIPTHKATEEEVKDYKLLYGEEGCPKVGDIIEGTFKNMDVNIQLNPANSCIPVSTYNSVIEEFNRTENDEHYKLKTVDVDSLYAGRNPGDPSTYASEANQISSLNVEDKESYMVSNNSAVIGINGNSTTSIAMGKGSSSSLSNGFSLSLKTTSTLGIESKEGCLVYLVASIKISATSTFGGGCTWANANSENITYTTTFAPLPESARTSTTSSGTKSSAYEFTAREVKWNPKELGSSNIQTVDGEELTNDTCVIGCLVQGADSAPPKLPRDLHVSSTTSNSETLRWNNTTNYNRKPESYKLYYSTSSNGNFVALKNNGKDVIISGDSEIYTVNGLKENTTYYFRLQAYSTKDASGSPSVLGPYASGKTKNSKDSQNEPIIIKYPVDLYKNIGEKPIFTIEAKPSNPENTISYKWQKLVVGNYIADWKDIDQEFGKSSSFNAAYFADNGVINEANAKSLDETVYRCIVTEYSNTDHNYYTNISRAAVLYIEKEHQHIYNNNGFCDFCGKYQPAVLNGNGFYEIRNAGQLFWFAALINGDKSNADFEAQQKGANAILLNDIDLEEREWTPIGNYETGIFDGNNYTISNLRISKNSSGNAISSQGFFGSVTGGTIKNFTILGEVKTTDYNVGGIAGSTSKDTILSNIIANVDVTGNEKVGGIVGNNSGIITNCYNNGNVTGVVELTGGITGFNDGSIIKCNNTGDVSSSYDFIGGIAGYNSGNIKLCSNSGNIKSPGSYIGGIAGENLTKYMDALISNCYNTGDITSSYDEDGYLGGIVGYNSYAFVESCYNVGKIQGGKSYSNALIGYNNEYDPKINTRVKNCYYLYTYDVGDSLGISRTESEFNSGEVAYLLNKGVTEGDQVWYQNIDNGKTPDLYPVLDNNSGTVYFPSEAYYSNFDKLLEEFDRNENGSFIIRTYDDLVKLTNLVDNNYSQYGKENYILENNIIVPSDFEWTKGIGSADDNKPFNGTFDGNGYIIFGLNIKNSKYGGLFERIGPKGIVKNLFVIDCDYNTASEYAGGIVAINDGLVDHCVSGIALTTGSTFDKNGQPIKLSDYNSDIKGVISGGVAAVNNGTIKACRNASFVNGTDVCGGITGINNEEGSIYGCASNITIGNSSSKLKGGLVGKNFGSIASSYTSAKISNATEENAGSIAGLNASENVKNVFYYTTNNIKVVGSNSTVIPDDTNKNKLKSEMLTKEFVDELNSVTDDSVEWIYNANTKLNNNYPTIKCDFYKQLIKKTSDGISVKGLMHRSLKVNSQAFDTNSESYKKLLSYAGNKTIVSSYNLTLTDSNENYIPSNLWYLSGVEISVPVNSSNELSVVGITDDGEIKEFEVLSMNNGKLTFKSDDIVSFALLSSNTPNQPDDSSKDNSINNSVVNTGDYNYSFAYILIISAIAVIVLSVLRRKKLEKD